jgi:hypothetical protein
MEKLDGDAPYKSCFARVFTDESISIILSGELDHIRETNAQTLERQILRTACKRKAVDMISERHSKIINSELFKMDEENLEKKDLKYVRQSMYRERKRLQPAQSKNQAEFLLMEHINVVLSISSNYIRYMVLRMVITFHWSSVCYHRNQKPVTGKCFHYSMTAARDSTLICVLKKFIEILKIGCM